MMTSRAKVRSDRGVDTHAAQSDAASLLGVLVGIVFLNSLISSLGSPFIPAVAETYDVSLSSAQWMMTVLQLSAAVLTPVIGRLGDGPRRREVLLAALAVVTGGTALTALPGPFALLLLGRAMQGVGLGLLPLTMAVAQDHLAANKVHSALAILAVTGPAGMGLGYPASGLLADVLGFHLTSACAAVFGIMVLLTAWRTLPTTAGRLHQPVDVLGATILGLGLVLIVGGLSQSTAWGWGSPLLLGSLAGGAVMVTGWVFHELRHRTPLVNLRGMTLRGVRVAHFSSILTGAGLFMLMSLVVRYVQTPASTGYGQARSVMAAGMLLVPFSTMTLVANKALPVLRRILGVGWLVPLGCLGFIAGMTLFLLARADIWWLAAATGATGFGVGLVFAATPLLIVRWVDPTETSSTLGFDMVLRAVGSALGSALIAAVLDAHTAPGERFPVEDGYDKAALFAIALWTLVAVVAWPRRGLWRDPVPVAHSPSAASTGDAIMGAPDRLRAEPSG